MIRRMRERGEGQLGCIVGLLVFLAAIFVAYKMIPIKVRAAELRGTVVDEAKAAGMRNDKVIKESILHKADTLELPLSEKDVKIRRSGNIIYVDVAYTVPVEFPGFTYQWNFKHSAENPVF